MPAPATEHVAPIPAVTYTIPAPVIEYMTLAPMVTSAHPSQIQQHIFQAKKSPCGSVQQHAEEQTDDVPIPQVVDGIVHSALH